MTFSESTNMTRIFISLIATLSLTACSNHQSDRNKTLAGMYKLYSIQSED